VQVPVVQSVFVTHVWVQIPEKHVYPGAQSLTEVQLPEVSVPARRHMAGFADEVPQVMSHLKPEPHCAAPAAVMFEQSFWQ
jgi:hypothetical protein